MKADISNLNDIKLLVDTFYKRVKENPTIGPIFIEKIEDRWPMHLDKMYRFWETVLLEGHSYKGSSFLPHAQLPIEWHHFEVWLDIFHHTVDEFFEGDVALKAKDQSKKMAMLFNAKIDYYKNNPQAKPIH